MTDSSKPICILCNHSYKNEKFLPRVLPCGHTICEICLLRGVRICPHCDYDIDCAKNKVVSCPINYAILKNSNSSLNVPHLSKKRLEDIVIVSKQKIEIAEEICRLQQIKDRKKKIIQKQRLHIDQILKIDIENLEATTSDLANTYLSLQESEEEILLNKVRLDKNLIGDFNSKISNCLNKSKVSENIFLYI